MTRTRGFSHCLCLTLGLACWISVAALSMAATDAWKVPQGSAFNFIEENDLFVDTDRHYTQGSQVSYFFSEKRTPSWADRLARSLPRMGLDEDFQSRFGLAVGQEIFTPGDITIPTVILNDRPYAGWLYGAVVIQKRGTFKGSIPMQDHLELDLGVIGPESLAKETQTWVHRIRGFEAPQGWDHQLDFEPGFALKLQRSWLLRWETSPGHWGIDAIPQGGASLGNTETSAQASGMLRIGYRLPYDFGFETIGSPGISGGGKPLHLVGQGGWDSGFYAFARASGKLVGYSAFLDGNLFNDSHHVNKIPAVAEVSAGGAVYCRRAEVVFSITLRSEEFDQQTERNAYGSTAIRIKF